MFGKKEKKKESTLSRMNMATPESRHRHRGRGSCAVSIPDRSTGFYLMAIFHPPAGRKPRVMKKGVVATGR